MAGIKGKININDLKKFQQNLSKLNENQMKIWNEAMVKELAARLLAKVIKRTPVGQYDMKTGKKGGTLRRGWAVGQVKKQGNEYIIDVINPVFYVPYVEFGHRTPNHKGWVNGKFMLTISEQELQADAPRIMMNKLNSFLKEVFK